MAASSIQISKVGDADLLRRKRGVTGEWKNDR